jgi:hypothetical protein
MNAEPTTAASSPAAAEFARAVGTTIDAVQHLYAEIDRLNETLLTRLLAEPTPFTFLGGTPIDPGDRTDRLDRRIRDQYHFLLEPGLDEAADLDENETEGDDEDENGDASVVYRARRLTRKRGRATIRAAEPCLAIGVVLHGQRQTAIGPHLRALVLTDWRVGSAPPKDGQFQMAHHILTRMLRSIEVAPDTDISRRLATRGKAYATGGKASQVAVSTRLGAAPRIAPLIELTSIEAVEAFVDGVKDRWRRMAGPTQPNT